MQDPLAMIEEVVARARQHFAALLDAPADTAATSEPEAKAIARPLLVEMFDAWDAARYQLANLGGQVALVSQDPTLAPAERDRQRARLIAAARTDIDRKLATIERDAAMLKAKLTGLAAVGRPGSVDEAAVAGLKADWRMLLDGLPGSGVVDRMLALVSEAQADGDTVAAWILTGTSWPRLYLESRGLAGELARWDRAVAGVLDVAQTGDAQIARDVLGLLEGPHGLAALSTGAYRYAQMTFDRVRNPTAA